MTGPPQSLLALSYAAVAGLGLLFVSQQGKAQGTEFSTAFPAAEAPSPLAAVLTPPSSAALASGIAAADKWRADAASEYEIRAVSEGEDAQGQVTARCRRSSDLNAEGHPNEGAPIVTGQGLSTNIIDASLVAYISAANKLAALASGAPSAPVEGSREAMK
jgi:hypothetical protein